MAIEHVLSPEDLLSLEADLIIALNRQGFAAESIKLIGLKGSGMSSTVFSVLIDDVYHVLKIYGDRAAYRREIRNLRRQIPLDRLFFVWPARLHRYRYDIVVIEVPEGAVIHSGNLTPRVGEQLSRSLLTLHSIRYRQALSVRSLEARLREKQLSAQAHAADYPQLSLDTLLPTIDQAIVYLRRHAKAFRAPVSRIHGDAWWGNVIVAEEDVYLIDWENIRRGDYCEDLAKFRVLADALPWSGPGVSFWEGDPDPDRLDIFMDQLLDTYEQHFQDPNIRGRYGFHCLNLAVIVFADYFFSERRAHPTAARILQNGLQAFDRYCRPFL